MRPRLSFRLGEFVECFAESGLAYFEPSQRSVLAEQSANDGFGIGGSDRQAVAFDAGIEHAWPGAHFVDRQSGLASDLPSRDQGAHVIHATRWR